MGLPRTHRLRRRTDFNRIYQKGTRFKSTHLTLRVLKRLRSGNETKSSFCLVSHPTQEQKQQSRHPEPLPTRIGISVSSKVDKRAVVRNRIRRKIQAIFRTLLPLLSPNCDLLVVVHPEAVQCDYRQFLQELEELLIEAEVIHGNPGGCVL